MKAASTSSCTTTCRAATASEVRYETTRELHAALVPMLEVLRAAQAIARPLPPAGPIADEINSYDAHMRKARGLAAKTRSGRLRIVERLLLAKFAGGHRRRARFIVDQLDA